MNRDRFKMSGLLIITDSFTAVGDNLYRVRAPDLTLLYGMAFFLGGWIFCFLSTSHNKIRQSIVASPSLSGAVSQFFISEETLSPLWFTVIL